MKEVVVAVAVAAAVAVTGRGKLKNVIQLTQNIFRQRTQARTIYQGPGPVQDKD